MKSVRRNVIVILLTLAFAPQAKSAQPSHKVCIGYSTMSATTAPLWVAQDEGFLAKNGIELETDFYTRPADRYCLLETEVMLLSPWWVALRFWLEPRGE